MKILSKYKNKYDYEIIYIDDWSPDNTWGEIIKLWEKDKHVKWVNFSRNFGKEIALTAGLEKSVWDAVITIDVDWQHPVYKIPEFIKKWEEWYYIVYNQRPHIKWSSITKRFCSWLFYKGFNFMSDIKLQAWATDYRLIDRRIVKIFLNFTERNRLYRWIIDIIWFEKYCLVFDALPNKEGRVPAYNFKKLYELSINSLTSFSVFPLKVVGYIWLLITIISIILLFIIFFDKIWVLNLAFSNLAIVVVINTTLIWIVLISLWLMALYIARIHEEVIGRPLYIIRDEINLK
jgi:dolichol-phosphate mannosyltransferase